MKRILLATLTLFPTMAIAAEPFGTGNATISGNVGIVSEYQFRGLAQTDEHPALQAGLDYAHDSGFYAGFWGSNVDFNDGDEATVEIDLYSGWGGEYEGFAWDLGGIYYAYPGADSSLDYDFFEVAASLGYDFDFVNLTGAVNYSPNFLLGSGHATYLSANAEIPLPYDFSLNGHVGKQFIEKEATFGSPDYADWSFGVGYSLAGFDLSLSYVDTDLKDGTECIRGWCDQRVIFGVTKAFE